MKGHCLHAPWAQFQSAAKQMFLLSSSMKLGPDHCPLKCFSWNLQFPHRVLRILPWCPCPFKNKSTQAYNCIPNSLLHCQRKVHHFGQENSFPSPSFPKVYYILNPTFFDRIIAFNWWLSFALQSNSNWVENCWIVKEWTEAETHLQVTEAKVHILFIKNQLKGKCTFS